ncbi:hypothetical protein HPB51_007905 [Rhipicephalus microplus]|uniref:Ig-like domain-containing protein n=1 Tax=Rhipicephalus microplus TaxID=6941 RepID=A0A9J6ENJ6_RHIMP|nr:hypothetical protein HPB51_007905 [Rhipicephalus microplus]
MEAPKDKMTGRDKSIPIPRKDASSVVRVPLLLLVITAPQCHAYDFIGAAKSLFKAREIEWSWDEYERCIRERSDDAPPRRQSVLALVGSKIELPCPGICFPPESEAQSPWHRVDPLSKSSIAPVALGKGDTRRQLMGHGALVVTDALPSDTGFYRCMWAGREYATYHVQVVAREPYTMVWENEHNSTEERADVAGLPLVTWLEWSEWSSCDRCGSVGRRRRAGICTVGYKARLVPLLCYNFVLPRLLVLGPF